MSLTGSRHWLYFGCCLLLGLVLFSPTGLLGGGGHGEGGHDHGIEVDAESEGEGYEIDLQFEQDPSKLYPWEGPVEFQLRALNQEGEVVEEDVTLSYRWEAPPRNQWFSTEFPVVEGEVLAESVQSTAVGRIQGTVPLPFRGTYNLVAEVSGPGGHARTEYEAPVSENPSKIANFSIFALVLLLVGFFGGLLIRFANRGTPTNAGVWFLGMLAVGLAFQPAAVQASGSGHDHGSEGMTVHVDELAQQVGTHAADSIIEPTTSLFPRPAEVGRGLVIKADRPSGSDLRVADYQVYSASGALRHRGQFSLESGSAQASVQVAEGGDFLIVVDFYRAAEDLPAGLPKRADRYHQSDGGSDGHDHASSGEEHDPEESAEPSGHDHGSDTGDEHEDHSDGDSGEAHDQETDPHHNEESAHEGHDHGAEHPDDESGEDHSAHEEDDHSSTSEAKMDSPGAKHQHDHASAASVRPAGASASVVETVEVESVSPPVPTLVKTLITLVAIVAAGFLIGFFLPGWIRRT